MAFLYETEERLLLLLLLVVQALQGLGHYLLGYVFLDVPEDLEYDRYVLLKAEFRYLLSVFRADL